MNFLMTNTVQFAMVVVGVVIVVVVATAIWVSVRKRKSERLRTQFGAPEYARTVAKTTGNQRNAEAALAERRRSRRAFADPGARSNGSRALCGIVGARAGGVASIRPARRSRTPIVCWLT